MEDKNPVFIFCGGSDDTWEYKLTDKQLSDILNRIENGARTIRLSNENRTTTFLVSRIDCISY